MRVVRIAVPVDDIGGARAFYETVLGVPADDTVPMRIHFHCDDVIVDPDGNALCFVDETTRFLGHGAEWA